VWILPSSVISELCRGLSVMWVDVNVQRYRRMPPVCIWARGVFGCICISAEEMYFSSSLLRYISSVWGQFKAEMSYLLKMHAEQIYCPFYPAEENGMGVKE